MDNDKNKSLIKPSTDTPFSIDFNWWIMQNLNWKVLLRNHLCDEHQTAYSSIDDDALIDWIDPVTAEVTQVDGLTQTFLSHCSKQQGFLNNMPLVDSLFFALLINNNKPLSSTQLSEIIGIPAQKILQVIGGNLVQKGIRPCKT